MLGHWKEVQMLSPLSERQGRSWTLSTLERKPSAFPVARLPGEALDAVPAAASLGHVQGAQAKLQKCR